MLRLAAVFPLALVACVSTGDEGMYILNNSAVTDTTCSLSGSPDQPQLGHGIVHYASPTAYVMTPLIQNRLQKTDANVDDVTKTIQLRGADVTLTLKAYTVQSGGAFRDAQPDMQLSQFTALFSGSVPPSGSANAFVDLIPPSVLRMIAASTGANTETEAFNAEVLAEVVVRGELGDDSIETEPYFYPVTVCNDCVIVDNGGCPMFIMDPKLGNACNPYQDGVVDCCTDTTGRLICPGPVAML